MDEHITPGAGDPAAPARHGFETPEGLRALLIRLHEAGPGGWQHDREAAELMLYTAVRYRRLAHKYGLDAWEVASAAFEVMLAPSTRKAHNPWAVVTRAVQITCGVEIRAAGMLVSSGKVRHTSRIAGFHDAIRFAGREDLADYHPAFAVSPATDGKNADSDDVDRTRVAAALSAIVELFASTGWDAVLVADCVEHVAYRLADLTSRANAVEVLGATTPSRCCSTYRRGRGQRCCGSCWVTLTGSMRAPRPATASFCASSTGNLSIRCAATPVCWPRSGQRNPDRAPEQLTGPKRYM